MLDRLDSNQLVIDLLESGITLLVVALVVGIAVWIGTRPYAMWLLMGLAFVLFGVMVTLVMIV